MSRFVIDFLKKKKKTKSLQLRHVMRKKRNVAAMRKARFYFNFLPAQPPMVIYKMEAQLEYVPRTLHTRYCTFGTDLHAQSVIINKISASELTRKFIKSLLLVGS